MNLRFYQCAVCGKIIAVFDDNAIATECCGQEMIELIPNMTDGAVEKHVPVFTMEGRDVVVKVGSEPHPMIESHCICWIGIRTKLGFLFRELKPGDAPEVRLTLSEGDDLEVVFAYCSVHGLWCSQKEDGK